MTSTTTQTSDLVSRHRTLRVEPSTDKMRSCHYEKRYGPTIGVYRFLDNGGTKWEWEFLLVTAHRV